jgi:hypothetical protein
MSMRKISTLILLPVLFLATGCATYDSSVPASTGLGAGAGALLGYGLTGSGLGAAAGAGAGALAGAITGTVLDETRRSRVQPTPQPYYEESLPQPQAYATQPDPTKGEFFNNTRWRLEILVDDSVEPMHLSPLRSIPVGMDIGNHQVVAKAYISTQFGERLVGGYSRSIYVDPKSTGWSLRFEESMF